MFEPIPNELERRDGFGTALFYNPTAGIRELDACDDGAADGLRAVAILEVGSKRFEVHAAGGTGSCNSKAITGLTGGSDYRLRACLRNGSGGANVYCDVWHHGSVY
ncbi:hypothetical protein [Saccharothrix deserti]|uniref:hypothetical protein n=1 Tax=Saccharothrix deserti TaxID=2593674 RepID=UPI00131D676E|nr:hypothetical protein [Saccharothrix deserti]